MPADKPEGAPPGERIAKVLSRAGVASRREAERMIELGQVAVNGKVIDSPALNVTARDRITVNGAPLAPPEPARLWLYYKPEGLVTSASDEKGRETVFDALPEDMPRVMSVGRLDLNSEGLLLLTNDGELKRRLELPSTGWLRKYRVRVNGTPTDPDLDPLRKGIEVEGERFQPMEVKLDRVQGANAWLTVGLREGRNREIRRAMNAIGLYVNRLIRVSYGPFRLGEMQPGEVAEVRPKVLRDQLGLDEAADENPAKKPGRTPGSTPARTVVRHRSATEGGRGDRPAGSADRPARGAARRGEETGVAPRPKAPAPAQASRPASPARSRAAGESSGKDAGAKAPAAKSFAPRPAEPAGGHPSRKDAPRAPRGSGGATAETGRTHDSAPKGARQSPGPARQAGAAVGDAGRKPGTGPGRGPIKGPDGRPKAGPGAGSTAQPGKGPTRGPRR